MADTSVTSIETGFPALPEGFFWRIRNANQPLYMFPGVVADTQADRFDEFVVCIMREGPMVPTPVYRNGWQRFLLGMEKTVLKQHPPLEIYSRPVCGVATAESIRDAALALLDVFNAAKLRERLLGDYPPKKLED